MGDNFGLNDNFSYLELELDSLDASVQQSGTALATDWPSFQVAGKGPIENVCAMKVIEVQIPFSWYVFNSVNNTFILTETGEPPATVTIPVGNYTASELAPVLATALTTASQVGSVYTVNYNHNTQKYTFYNNVGTSAPFSFTFGVGPGNIVNGVPYNSGNKNPRLWIGFPPGVTTSQTFSATLPGGGFAGDALVAPNAQQVSGPNYLYLNSSAVGSTFDVFLPKGAFNLFGGQAGPQIAKIPVNVNPGGTTYWQDPDPLKWFKADLNNFAGLDLYLTLGNTTSQIPLQLNGLSFSVKLGVLIRESENVDYGNSSAANGRVFTRQGPKRIRGTY
jgi:hypothetical protein